MCFTSRRTAYLAIPLMHGLVASAFAAAADKPDIIVFYSDDHGYADLGVQGQVTDVRTPNLDALALGGARATDGYTTAPQCVPSRAGLLSGRSQNRFGVESNGDNGGGGADTAAVGEILSGQTPIAARLQKAGYVTAQFGKWHLGALEKIGASGFTYQFPMFTGGMFPANIDSDGVERPLSDFKSNLYHIDACSRAAAGVIKRHKAKPLFLYVAYRAPHVPLDPPAKYVSRFPGPMAERRRMALAMISAVDDGVGLIVKTLKDEGLLEKTLIFFVGDNGAPLKETMADSPLDQNGWDGSMNVPLNGEKGTLMDGGMHVPFVVAWKGVIPPAQVYHKPLWTLDIAATAVALAGITVPHDSLDGVNIIPFLSGADTSRPHDQLTWRWMGQSAIRWGDWKYLRGSAQEYLFHLGIDPEERYNLMGKYPAVESKVKAKLTTWVGELDPPGFDLTFSAQAADYFDFYLIKPATKVTVIPATCTAGSFTLPGGKRISQAGIYLDTVGTGANPMVNAYALPEACAGATGLRGRGEGLRAGFRIMEAGLQVRVEMGRTASLEVFDLAGHALARSGTPARLHSLDARGWKPGVYVLKSTDGKHSESKMAALK